MSDNGWAEVTAVVLAGGLGTRLRAVVADRPKVLAEVRGRPFLAYLFDQVQQAGVREVVVCTGYRGELVQVAFGPQYRDLRLTYSHETEPLGTGGALRLAQPRLYTERALVMNGDSYYASDLDLFRKRHFEKSAQATILLAHMPDTGRYGQVQVTPDGRVANFTEKGATAGPGWISAGLYLIQTDCLAQIPQGRAVSLERETFPAWVGQGLYGCQSEGRFLDIGTPETLAQAEAFLPYGQTVRRDWGMPESMDWRVALVKKHLLESAEVKRQVAENGLGAILAAADLIAASYRGGGKLLICGNGGSAADCQHMAAEFVSRLTKDFKRPALPAIALTTDTSFLTAFANDCGFDAIFARQVEALGKPGDVLLGISTSGNSENVIQAIEAARTLGLRTLALVGAGGRLADLAEVAMAIPSSNTQYIQEAHLAVEHLVCAVVERLLFRGDAEAAH